MIHPDARPPILPAGTDDPLPHLELADIVRLKTPYSPAVTTDEQPGPFEFGIVAEIVTRLPSGGPRNISLYLYDPTQRLIYLGPNGIPQFVDFHVAELVPYKRAKESGYVPLSSVGFDQSQ